MELVAPIVLPVAAQFRKPQCGHSREHHLRLHPGAPRPPQPVIAPKPRVVPSEQSTPGCSTPGLHSPTIRSQPGTSPGRQRRVPGSSVPAVPGRGPGLAPGGTMAVPPAAPLTSSRLFPSLLCTRHAPCEPFLRGIRTKGSWEYLSGTGESGDAAGGTLLPSPRAPSPWHHHGHRHGHGQCWHRRRGCC